MVSTAEIVAFVNANVGKPYRAGACGPDAFDCLGLVHYANRELYGRDFKIADRNIGRAALFAAAAKMLRGEWPETRIPAHGGIVTMRKDQLHIGMYFDIDRGIVFHALEGVGVCCHTLDMMTAMGFVRPKFYDYRG